MSAFPRGRIRLGLMFGVIAMAMMGSLTCYAKSTGVDEDNALQSGPCYQALVDRNAAQPTTAPNRELGSACETEHGDVEKAWARVLRLWGSDSTAVPDYDAYRPADAPVGAASPKWLAIFAILLVYAVFGTPMRSAARLFAGGGGAASVAAVALLASLIFRLLIALALILLFGVSYTAILGSILLVALILARPKAPGVLVASPAPDGGKKSARGFSIFVAEVINDVAGAAIGLVGLALLAQHDPLLLVVAVAFAIVASAPIVVLARRRLRANPLVLAILSALLAAALGAFALSDPPIAAAVGGAMLPSVLVPLALAAAVFGVAWRSGSARRLRSQP
jgi:hypothetical protein